MFRTTRTGSVYKYHPLADSLYSFHVHLAFHHFLRSLVVLGVECLLLPSTRTSSLSMVTAEPVSTSILVGLVPTHPSTKTAASLAMLPAEWVAWGWRALLKGLWRGQSFRICPRSLQFQHTGTLSEGFERSWAFWWCSLSVHNWASSVDKRCTCLESSFGCPLPGVASKR